MCFDYIKFFFDSAAGYILNGVAPNYCCNNTCSSCNGYLGT